MRQGGIASEPGEPVVTFAFLRLTLPVAALAGVLIFSVPHTAALAIFIAAVGLPWAVGLYMLSYRATPLALSPWVAVGDIALLAGAELISPSTYAAVRFFALFVVAAHAQLQGDERGLAFATLVIVVLVPIGVLEPHSFAGDLIGFYEAIFAISALAVAVFVGRLSTTRAAGMPR